MIPLMTDPRGRHWPQPSTDRIAVDDTHAVMTADTLAQLAEYSSTLPTGVYSGKIWRRRVPHGWLLCWYADEPRDPAVCRIEIREVLLA